MQGMSAKARYVLVSDVTLNRDYRGFPLLDFLPCAPSGIMPRFAYLYLSGRAPPPLQDLQASLAPYSLRKLEAALLRDDEEAEVKVPHESYVEDFISDETEVIAVTTMDPLGLGPLTVSYQALFGTVGHTPYVRIEFERLISRINIARRGTKAKLIVGGPGAWEFTVRPEELDRLGIDYCFQGEADEVASDLFTRVSQGDLSGRGSPFYVGFQTFDGNFRRTWKHHDRFISRGRYSRQAPEVDDIPDIRRPSVKSLVEVMRGCGIGCDFCEVTLRPPRYYPPKKVQSEVSVNASAGFHNAWLHSDEIFAYQHGRNFEPNQDALCDLFRAVMSVRGMARCNPTHGRISVPGAFPDLIMKLSSIMGAGPFNWIGLQVGLETGSERLARLHMPNKTLPLKIGSDGSWFDIVWRGVYVMNRYYWRPAFTVQLGQEGETSEDNWETVAMVNRLSNSFVEDRPFEFTVTPLQNVPLGLMKARGDTAPGTTLSESQLAVYYACYRHLAKMAARDAARESRGRLRERVVTYAMLRLGANLMLQVLTAICRKRGLDTERIARFGLNERAPQPPSIVRLAHAVAA